MKMRGLQMAVMAVLLAAIHAIFFTTAEAKPRYISGDNYNATQFSAPGLEPGIGQTIKMLIGRNVDAPPAKSGHEAKHGEAAGHGALHVYDQTPCSSFCRTVPGGLDSESNEAYEACLGPCFKCAQISIRAQADAGATDVGQPAFDACYAK